MDPVAALFQQARHLLGTSTPTDPELAATSDEPSLASQHPADWESDASAQVATTNATLDNHRNQIRSAQHSAIATITAANTIGQKARDNLTAVESAWQQDKSTFTPTTAQDQAALLQAGQQRINDAAQIVEDTAAQYQHAAQQLQTQTTEISADAPDPTPVPRSSVDGVHGTDSRPMPLVLAPGQPGPYGYTEAVPGSGVWIPDDEISGNAFVVPPGSDALPPFGYEKIGKAPDGSTLYWPPPQR